MPDRNREEIEKLEKLYAANPAGRIFTHLAEAYRKAGELDRSIDILDSGLQLHPDYPSAHVVLGRVKLDLGEKDEAAAAFRRVLELDRHNMVALRALGDLAVEAGRFDEARHYLGELVQIDPADLELAEQLDRLPEELTAEAAIEALEVIPGDEAEGETGDPGSLAGPEVLAAPGEVEEAVFGEIELESGDAAMEDQAEADDGEEHAEEDSGAEQTATEAGDEAESGPGPELETGGEARAPDQDRAAAPLDAWVESLHVIEPGLQVEDVADLVDDAGPIARDAVAGEEADADRDAVEASDLDEESNFEDVVEIIAPDPEEYDSIEPEEDVLTLEADQIEDEDVAGDTDEEADTAPDDEADEVAAQPEEETVWLGDPALHAKVPDPVEWVSEEDWERIAAHSTWSESAESAESVEAVPPMDPETGEDERDKDADEVATETLAEVYAAQGFRAEAAEIYRKLLHRRPDDARLLARLAELEGEAEETRVERTEPAEEAGVAPAGPEMGEPSWPGGEEQAVAGPTPYAWMDAGGAAEPDEGSTIGEHLRALLAWRPEAEPEPEQEPTLLLDEVAEEPPEFPTFGTPAIQEGTAQAAQDPESEDLEMFRSWLKSLRK